MRLIAIQRYRPRYGRFSIGRRATHGNDEVGRITVLSPAGRSAIAHDAGSVFTGRALTQPWTCLRI